VVFLHEQNISYIIEIELQCIVFLEMAIALHKTLINKLHIHDIIPHMKSKKTPKGKLQLVTTTRVYEMNHLSKI
jgi:hypothetical protein